MFYVHYHFADGSDKIKKNLTAEPKGLQDSGYQNS